MQFEYVNKRVEVKAHGDINAYDICNYEFTRAIALAKDKKCNMYIDLHSIGGSVFEGNLIYNTLVNSGLKIEVMVAGISASMATVIMLAAEKISINDDAFLMLHRPTSWVDGDSETMQETAKLLQSMSGIMSKRYSEMSGKTIEEVNALWLNGKDNWLDAQEALSEGLVHEIVPSGKTAITKKEVQANAKDIFDRITASLKSNHKNTENMKKNLIATLNLKGVNENSSEEEIMEAINTQKKSQDDVILGLQKKQGDLEEKALDDLLDEAITSEQITTEQKATYKEAGKTLGIEKVKAMLPVAKKVTAQATPTARLDSLIKGGAPAAGTTNDTWDTLAAQSGKLEALEKSDPEAFKALFKSKYGTEPK
jgi:ATP-dependent Clp protease protease subunit